MKSPETRTLYGNLALTLCALVLAVECRGINLRTEVFIDNPPSEPMFLTAPVGDPNYVYTGGRFTGNVLIHDRQTGATLGTFLDLPAATPMAQDGLLYMAFHPDYATNGLFYTYTFRNDDTFVRVTEYRRSATNPLVADPTYERQILEVPNPNRSHNGGWMGFSPIDGYLYVTTGDGGANQGPNNGLPAQDLFDPHGKLLRVDVNADDFPADDSKNYSIPATNPFDGTDGLPEVFAYGLRHTFRASFDRLTGDLYLADVGGTLREEINFLPAGTSGGQNFGWRPKEGSIDNPFFDDPLPPDAIDPIHEYPHAGGASVTGGYVYRGSDIPELQGTYFYSDFINRDTFSFEFDGATVSNLTDRTNQLFPGGFGRSTAFGEDGLGELYVVDYFFGDIYKILSVPPVPGDYSGNGFVDATDYAIYRENLGAPAGTLQNDPVGGEIGIAHYNAWAALYGDDFNSTLSIPEPATLSQSALLLLGLAIGRRWA